MRPVDVKKSALINFNDENNDKDPKLKVMVMWQYQNVRIFCSRLHSKFVRCFYY